MKLTRKNYFLDNLFRKFIKKYMVAFTILRDELEELVEKVEISKPVAVAAPESERERERERDKDRERQREREREREKERDRRERESLRAAVSPRVIEKPILQTNSMQTIETRKQPERVVQPTRTGPSILDLTTPEQKTAYEEFKKRLAAENITLSDELMRRFLISKEFVIEDAIVNVQKYVEWRKEMKFEEFQWDDPELFSSLLQARIVKHIGFDKEGRPIAFLRLRNYFPSKSPEDLFRKFAFGFLTWVIQQIKPGVEQYAIVIDATDISKDNVSLGQFTHCLKNLSMFFPQYVYKMFVVNGGFFIKMIYNTMKPLLKERHKKRLVFCNTSGNEAYNLLKVEMDDEMIPVHMGGKFMDY